jgi:hypothetical protein
LEGRAPVLPQQVRIEGIGLNPLDRRRVDVAVDLTPFRGAVRVEMAIVGPDDQEVCSTTLLQNRDAMLDKILHLRQDATAGEHVIHVGVFVEDALVAHEARRFSFPPVEAG